MWSAEAATPTALTSVWESLPAWGKFGSVAFVLVILAPRFTSDQLNAVATNLPSLCSWLRSAKIGTMIQQGRGTRGLRSATLSRRDSGQSGRPLCREFWVSPTAIRSGTYDEVDDRDNRAAVNSSRQPVLVTMGVQRPAMMMVCCAARLTPLKPEILMPSTIRSPSVEFAV